MRKIMKDILNGIPDKTQEKNTTSIKFKKEGSSCFLHGGQISQFEGKFTLIFNP